MIRLGVFWTKKFKKLWCRSTEPDRGKRCGGCNLDNTQSFKFYVDEIVIFFIYIHERINNFCPLSYGSLTFYRFNWVSFFGCNHFHFISFYLYIYTPDSQESDGGAVHRASNYPDLFPEMPRYCCPLEIFISVFLVFTEIYLKFITALRPPSRENCY